MSDTDSLLASSEVGTVEPDLHDDRSQSGSEAGTDEPDSQDDYGIDEPDPCIISEPTPQETDALHRFTLAERLERSVSQGVE
jgi:hypothetical protein